MKFSLKLSYHKVYFSATWCKRSLLYDQTIEDINIFSPAFLVELRGVAQITWWLKLPHSPLHVLYLYQLYQFGCRLGLYNDKELASIVDMSTQKKLKGLVNFFFFCPDFTPISSLHQF